MKIRLLTEEEWAKLGVDFLLHGKGCILISEEGFTYVAVEDMEKTEED